MSETPETDAAQIFLGFNPDEGDYFVPAEIASELERQRNETSHNLASIVAAILKRDGRDVFDMSATDRLAELHTAERQRDEARETAERYRLEANAMMMQRDRLAAVLQRIRDGYGGQVASPNCCEDCDYLLPIDEALAAVKGENNE